MLSKIFFLIVLVFLVTEPLLPQTADTLAKTDSLQETNYLYKDRLNLGEQKETSFFAYLIRVIFVSGILILLIILGFQWYKKYLLPKMGTPHTKIQILGRQAIGPKQYIVLVVIENRKFALGVTDHSITVITDLGEIEEIDELQDEAGKHTPFSSLLKKLSRGQNE